MCVHTSTYTYTSGCPTWTSTTRLCPQRCAAWTGERRRRLAERGAGSLKALRLLRSIPRLLPASYDSPQCCDSIRRPCFKASQPLVHQGRGNGFENKNNSICVTPLRRILNVIVIAWGRAVTNLYHEGAEAKVGVARSQKGPLQVLFWSTQILTHPNRH